MVMNWHPGKRCTRNIMTKSALIFLLMAEIVSSMGPPVFNYLPKTIKVSENNTNALSTIYAAATHPDGDPFQYSMTTVPKGGPFSINNVTGEITTPAFPGFDFENISVYSLEITVDDGNFTNKDILTVEITDVNERPTFVNLPGVVHLPEDTIPTYIIYKLLSTDPENDKVTYHITSPFNPPFDIDPNMGILKLQTNPGLDYETRRVYQLVLQVADHEMHSEKILKIFVDDVNEPPRILNKDVILTLPRSTVGPVSHVQVYDPDLNDELTYMFSSVPASEFGDPFVLNPSTGELSVQSPPGLDPSVTNRYTLNITVMDKEGLMDWTLLTIRIVDKTDVPEIWNLPATVIIPETQTVGVKIFEARTIDMINGTLVYDMSVSPDDRKFRWTVKRGEVWYLSNPGFDFETTPSYQITLTVSNGKKVSKPKIIDVIIRDMNEQPTLQYLPASVRLKEDLVNAVTVYKVTGTDPDTGTTLTYNMTVDPHTGSDKFAIDRISGEITVVENPNLDYETESSYNLKIMAFDGEIYSKAGNVSVEVDDVNEPPTLPASAVSLSIKEKEIVGFELPWNCTAEDEDENENLLYHLATTPNSDYFLLDTSNGCGLRLVKNLDSDDPDSPSAVALVVSVTDSARHETAASVMVNVIKTNDYAPKFDPPSYFSQVAENEDVDYTVVKLHAEDGDSGIDGEIVYNITTPIAREYFEVSTDGTITLVMPLNREEFNAIAFDVEASDLGTPSLTSTASVVVVVLEENDNRPTFLQPFYDLEVRYDAVSGTIVGNLTAVDTDKPSAILEYSILGLSHDFEIGSVSGILQTKRSLLPSYRYLLYVQADDMALPPETSEAIGVRVDTYVCEKSLVRMDVYREPSFFDSSGKKQFTSAMAGLFPGFVAKVGGVKQGDTSGKSAVLLYILRNNSTGSASTIYNKKEFVPVDEILKWTTYGSNGRPVAYLTAGPFSRFPVTKISCECCPINDENWWLDTTEGKVTTGILSTIAAGLLLAALTKLAMFLAGKCKKYFTGGKVTPPSGRYSSNTVNSGHKPTYKEGGETKWWRLQPKTAFDENSGLDEKYRPPSPDSLKSQGAEVNTTDVRAELTASEQGPAKSLPPAVRPKPAGAKGLWF